VGDTDAPRQGGVDAYGSYWAVAVASVEILIVLLLIAVNGVLAMSELAIVSARKVRLQQRAEAGDTGARTALALAAEPNRFLSTVQVGITLVGILAGAFGGATLARSLGEWLKQFPAVALYSEPVAVGLVVLVITYLSLVLGELVPKRLALYHAERIAARMAPPMRLLATLGAPVVTVLSFSTEAVLRLFGVRASTDPSVTEEEIRLVVAQGAEAGVLESAEQEIVQSLFRLSDQRVGDLMTPRLQMIWLDVGAPATANWQKVVASGHSRFPVCEGDVEQVLGVVALKDLWAQVVQGQGPDLRAAMHPPLFLPERTPGLRALEAFKTAGIHLALVLDEFGGIQGLLTLTDVLEAIVGDLPAAGEAVEQLAVQREDGSWLLGGLLPIDEFKVLFALDELPEEDEYQTLSGFVLMQFGRIPMVGDHFTWAGLRFEIMDMDRHRIDKVLVQPQAEE
jgi:putative hemolysin